MVESGYFICPKCNKACNFFGDVEFKQKIINGFSDISLKNPAGAFINIKKVVFLFMFVRLILGLNLHGKEFLNI